MSVGERIRYLRNLRGITQKQLGMQAGLPEKTADIRIAQYESSSRSPRDDLTEKIASVLGVSTDTLNVPNIDDCTSVMQTLFALEDLYGFKVDLINDEPIIRLNKNNKEHNPLRKMLLSWYKESEKWQNGAASRDMYDDWRYNFPP